MPTSDTNQVPGILKLIGECQPDSVLDVGVGWGRYGALLRLGLERGYADISDRSNWQVRIDGIEAFAGYIGDIQRSVYNEIHLGTVQKTIGNLGTYDVILLGDVIEHLEKDEGVQLLKELVNKARLRVVLATPNGRYDQDAMFGNQFEKHRSVWSPADFAAYPGCEIYANRKSLIAVLSNQPSDAKGRRWRLGELRRWPFSAAIAAWFRYRWQRLRGIPTNTTTDSNEKNEPAGN